MFKCKCCQILQDENAHLRGLVDRMMVQIAPKQEDETVDPRIADEVNSQQQTTYGE